MGTSSLVGVLFSIEGITSVPEDSSRMLMP